MKAYVLRDNGKFGIEEAERPVAGQDEVIVQVKAAGICGSDIARIYHNGAYSYPLIPGHEFSGTVVEAGNDGADSGDARGGRRDSGSGMALACDSAASWVGKRVGVFPLIPCGECLPCRQGSYEMCRHYSYLGSRRDGGFAEYVSVPVWNLVELPGEVTYEQAAMMEPMAVAVHAMRKAFRNNWMGNVRDTDAAVQGKQPSLGRDIKNGSGSDIEDPEEQRDKYIKSSKELRIAISGLGTIGLFLLMFLKETGYEDILVIGNKDIQKEKALAFGVSADRFYDNRNGDVDAWLERRAGERGIDIFFECVGANETLNLAVSHTTPGGRVMLVGNPASDMLLERQTYWKILRNQLTLSGTWNSSFCGPHRSGVSACRPPVLRKPCGGEFLEDDWRYVLARLASGRAHPEWIITHRYDFDGFLNGFELMRGKTEEYLKVMLRV